MGLMQKVITQDQPASAHHNHLFRPRTCRLSVPFFGIGILLLFYPLVSIEQTPLFLKVFIFNVKSEPSYLCLGKFCPEQGQLSKAVYYYF